MKKEPSGQPGWPKDLFTRQLRSSQTPTYGKSRELFIAGLKTNGRKFGNACREP
ncbi:hypothetical protein CLF_105859, partial [Clonorchis sinensis]